MRDHDTEPWNDGVMPWYVPAIIIAAFVGLIAGMLWAFRVALSATPRERELMRELMADPFVVFTANPEWTVFLLAVGAVPLVLFAIYTWRMRRDNLTHITADGQISVPESSRTVQYKGVELDIADSETEPPCYVCGNPLQETAVPLSPRGELAHPECADHYTGDGDE